MCNNEISKLPYIVAIDFDGTLCQDIFPEIGKAHNNVIQIVKEYKRYGWKIILWSCRNGKALDEAVEWCKNQGLEFDAVNENIPEVKKMFGGDTRKIFANAYVDDRNVLVPVLESYELAEGGLRSAT